MVRRIEARKPKRSTGWQLAFAVLSAWLLSGCITTLAPVQFVPREALASVREMALAVGDDGVKHYVWTECAGDGEDYTCVLVYSRTSIRGVLYSHTFIEPIGTYARYPDVAVNSDGEAYVVRSVCTGLIPSSSCVDYWSMFPADPDGVTIDTEALYPGGLPSEGPPFVVARGDDVYASLFVDAGAGTRLRYRQLSGGGRVGRIEVDDSIPPHSVSLAIDSAGDLHAAWIQNPVGETRVAYATNKGSPSHFDAATTYEDGTNFVITRPDIALDSGERPYIAYSVNTGAADIIKVRCMVSAPTCWRDTALLTVPTVNGSWGLWGRVSLEMIGAQPNVVFAAIHDSLTYNEVWWYRPTTSANSPPTRVTNTTNVNEDAPLIAKENSDFGDVPVVGWRQYVAQLQAANATGGGFCHGDVFMTYEVPSNIRQVFEDRGSCSNIGLDLAANGEWVAGAWIDRESEQIEAHAVWTAFNAYQALLPLVRR